LRTFVASKESVMADNNSEGTVKGSFDETLNQAGENAEHAFDTAREYIENGGEMAGEIIARVSRFVQREPWLAVGCAFVLGYTAAQIVKRIK
jgi:ElaB/YqjD/DUF883 family membrane-anchored ribosome-binding protein